MPHLPFSPRKALRVVVLSLLVAATTIACQPGDNELSPSFLAISTECYGGSKMSVDLSEALWVDGDTLRINARTSIVHRKDTAGTSLAYIPSADAATQGLNRALFPHTLTSSALSSDAATVSLPRCYIYRTDAAGRQLIPMPMAACEEAGQPLLFRHLTGALRFRIVNSLSVPIAVDSLVVESNAYTLSGNLAIDFSHLASLAPQAASAAADRRVSMLLGGVTLAAGDSLCFVLPVAAVGADNHFTITISSRNAGTRYIFSRTQQAGGALERNMLGHAVVSIEQGSYVTAAPIFEYSQPNASSYNMHIRSASEFLLMAQAISEGWTIGTTSKKYSEQSYDLTADIDLDDRSIQTITGFTGSLFDGNDHSLSNLHITSSEQCCALFASAKQVSNLHLSNVHLRCAAIAGNANADYYLSPLVANGSTTISHCSVSNYSVDQLPSIGKHVYIGGVLGYVKSNTQTTIEHCNVDAALNIDYSNSTSITYAGLVSYIESDNSSITSSHQLLNNTVHDESTIIVHNDHNIRYGGIAGRLLDCCLTNDTWVGNVQLLGAAELYAGGLCGIVYSDHNRSSVTNCTVSGEIRHNTSSNNTIYIGYGIGFCIPTYLRGQLHTNVSHDVLLNGEPLVAPHGNN